MISHLTLKDVGPARDLRFDFAPRLNVLTGDSGCGKSFVLDVLWFALTETWAGEMAFPFRPPEDGDGADVDPRIECMGSAGGYACWIWAWAQKWVCGQNNIPRGVVIYVRGDGTYAVSGGCPDDDLVVAHDELWRGRKGPDARGGQRVVIGGLIEDLVRWQQRPSSPEFGAFCKVLALLSAPDAPMTLSEPTRVHLRDRKDIPTVTTPHGVVPVTLAAAGMKRALSLAYLLVWAWTENKKLVKARRCAPMGNVVLLIDEPEQHQHPAWQRSFLPAVLRAACALAPEARVKVFAATHSSPVLASLDFAMDALFPFGMPPRLDGARPGGDGAKDAEP